MPSLFGAAFLDTFFPFVLVCSTLSCRELEEEKIGWCLEEHKDQEQSGVHFKEMARLKEQFLVFHFLVV